MGLTATWAITTDPEAFRAVVGNRFDPLGDWTPTTDAGDVKAPWSVLESLELNFAASTSVLEAWATEYETPLLLVGIFDSDGAYVAVHGPRTTARVFIRLEGYAGSLFPGYAPFDDEGNMLTGPALAELEEASEAEFRQICTDLRAAGQATADAATLLHLWAHESGLLPATVQTIEGILDSDEVLAEDAVRALVDALGLRHR